MSIEIKLFATLRNGREKKFNIGYNEGITPCKIIKDLNIKAEDVAILLINGRDRPLDTVISDGDVVAIFPPVGGG